MSSITVKNLTKNFGEFVAIKNVNFIANEGELVTLLGPSGSGKSTILRIIAGLESPDTGQIFFGENNITQVPSRKRNIGFVFQHYALFKHMTVEKNIAFGLEIKKRKKCEIQNRVKELIYLVNLNGYENQYPHQLSGGQRQRVALARALAPEPAILLLDEPFGALDAKVRENLAVWLKNLHHKINLTSIFVTHDQNEAIKIADKIVAINRGQVEQIGTSKEIYENPESKFVASFIGKTNVISGTVNGNYFFIENLPKNHPIKLLKTVEDGPTVLLVRPEDIIISKKLKPDVPLSGYITEIKYCGGVFEINISLQDLKIKSTKEKNFLLNSGVKIGDDVNIGISHYKVFNTPEGHDKVHKKLSQLGYIE